MFVGIRLPEETVAAIDEQAEKLGTTRSGWIAHAVARSLEGLVSTGTRPGRPRRRKGDAPVFFRMSADELDQVERAAKIIGLTRTQFFIATARGRVWPDQLVIMPNLETKKAMREAIKELHAIGRNLNQVVHAMHAAALPGSGMNIESIAIDLKVAAAEASASALAVQRAIVEHLSAEQDIWRWRQ